MAENGPMILRVSSSPHVKSPHTIRRIMYTTVLTLIPPVVAAVYFFGLYALLLVLTCIVSCIVTEHIFMRARKKASPALDGSAMITGILLALILPPRFPLWAAAIGSVFAIAIGKQVFGGLGFNIFNPALLGRAFLMAAFPVLSTTWISPVDATTTATPLALWKFSAVKTPYLDLFFGNVGGSLGETSALAILVGGIALIILKYVDWRLPLSYLLSVVVFGGALWLINPAKFPDPLFHLLAGGLMLGAFYMITDMVTSPISKKGRVVFGIGGGFLVVLIRVFGGLPEGVMYSILLMNGFRPWIDRIFVPKKFGEVRG
jgi:electron transport complex protein RnfD